MGKLNFMGIGPKIAAAAFPWLAAAIFFTLKYQYQFTYFENENGIIYYPGLAFLIIGSIMYLITAPLLLKGLKETKLVTTGTFYFCRNPLYSAIILFIIPGISFMMNSWLVLTTSAVSFALFKIFIKSEYAELENHFGDDFRKYRTDTPELFPLPIRKWFKKG